MSSSLLICDPHPRSLRGLSFFLFFLNDTPTTEISTLSLHDALPICVAANVGPDGSRLGVPEHPITIRDLLTHTAGIQDVAPAAIHDYPQLMNVSLDEVVRQLARQIGRASCRERV